MTHALAWFEIPAMDIDRAQHFYETIFACEMRRLELGDLRMAIFPAQGVGGAVCQHPTFYRPSSQDGPLLYLSAEPDLAVVLERVAGAGGRIVIPKRQVSADWGYMAAIVDSEGNRIALHSMT
jgi:uncharacterized protein